MVTVSILLQTHSHTGICLYYNSLLSPALCSCIMIVHTFSHYKQNQSLPYILWNIHQYLYHSHHHTTLLSSPRLHKSTYTCLFIYQNSNPCRIMISSLSYILVNLVTQCSWLYCTRMCCLLILNKSKYFYSKYDSAGNSIPCIY